MKAKILLSAYYDGSGETKVHRVYLPNDFIQAEKDLDLLFNLNVDKKVWIQECELFTNIKASVQRIENKKERILSVEETMSILRVKNRVTLWRWSKCGYLLPIKIGRKSFYKEDDVNMILTNNKGK